MHSSRRSALVAALAAVAVWSAPLLADERGEIVLAQAESPAPADDGELTEAELDAAARSSAKGPPPGVEIMRVRGRGIAAIETEIPSSVTQFDAATIEALGAQDISDLSRVTPNVTILQPGSTQANFFIRGVGLSDFGANSAGAVTIFQDDVSLNAPAIQTGQLFDIRNVEIVRGPQGTGPYRNASAGAIRVISAKPTGNYGAQLRSTVGRYAADGGKGANHGIIQDYEGYLETPLVSEVISSRFAFRFRDSEPFQTNGCATNKPLIAISDAQFAANPNSGRGVIPSSGREARNRGFGEIRVALENAKDAYDICGERSPIQLPDGGISQIPPGLPGEVDDEHNWATRGTLRFQPQGSNLDVMLNGHAGQLDEDGTYGQAIGTLNAPSIASPFLGGENSAGYREPDVREEFDRLCPDPSGCNDPNGLSPILADLQQNLTHERPLDIRPYRGDYNKKQEVTRDSWGGFLSADTEIATSWFGDLDVYGIASYDTYDRLEDQDSDFSPDILFETRSEDEAWQTYEELRIGGELAAHPFEWEVGGWFLYEDLDFESTTLLGIGLFSAERAVELFRDYNQTTTSAGAWWQFAWDFSDDFTLEGGVRFNWERKEFDLFVDGVIPEPPVSQEETWQVPTGALILRYHLDPQSSIFMKYSRGFKSGHFNSRAAQNLDLVDLAADPETNDAWEAGIAGSWLDGRLSGSTSFFYYRYTDYQVFIFRTAPNANPTLEIVNAEEAENYGVEVEARLEPLRGWAPRALEGLVLTGNFSWLHGEYIDFQDVRNFRTPTATVPIVVDFSGDQLLNSPQYTVSASATWTFDLGRFGYLIPRYDVNWSDDTFYGVNEGRGLPGFDGQPSLPEYAIAQKAYFLHNVRLAYRTPTSNIEVAGWIRNLEDQVYKTFAFDASFSRETLNFVGAPRTMGIDVTVTF